MYVWGIYIGDISAYAKDTYAGDTKIENAFTKSTSIIGICTKVACIKSTFVWVVGSKSIDTNITKGADIGGF